MTSRRTKQARGQGRLPFARRRRASGRGRRARASVPHVRRPAHSADRPLHVTVRLRGGLPSLRQSAELAALRAAFSAGSDRFGFRLVHFSVQRDHLHLIAEAQDRLALSRGMKGLLVRIARALNRLWRRRGPVFADRYHARALRTPREVRNTLVYVLQNSRKHIGRYAGIDPGSSGAWFDGWAGCPPLTSGAVGSPPVVAARTWLLRVGWTRYGRIGLGEAPR